MTPIYSVAKNVHKVKQTLNTKMKQNSNTYCSSFTSPPALLSCESDGVALSQLGEKRKMWKYENRTEMGANLNQQETFLGTLEQAHFCFIQCYSRFWIFPRLCCSAQLKVKWLWNNPQHELFRMCCTCSNEYGSACISVLVIQKWRDIKSFCHLQVGTSVCRKGKVGRIKRKITR